MISDVDNTPRDDSLVNEARLLAALATTQSPTSADSTIDPELAVQTLLDDSGLSQLVLRREGPSQSLTGYFRLVILPGQQRVSWHVPVAPAFSTLPVATAEPLDGTEARIRFTKVEKFGARAELILPAVAEGPQTVLVVVNLACTPAPLS